MATPADQRLLELLDKWLESLELHLKYTALDSESYWKVQPWPEHQRPSRWIIDLAKQKTAALKAQVQERIRQGDARFSDSLELMTFLANLIGSEHIERFIPLADRANEHDLRAREESSTAPAAPPPPDPGVAAPAVPAPPVPAAAARAPAPAADFVAAPAPAAARAASAAPAPAAAAEPAPASQGAPGPAPAAAAVPAAGTTTITREMPHFVPPKRPAHKPAAARQAPDSSATTREMPELAPARRRAPAPVGTAHVARTERRSAPSAPARTASRQPARIAPPSDAEAAREQVIADAARLVQWGRKWYELAELIARMADRPPLPEVRRILKDNKTAIERKAGGG